MNQCIRQRQYVQLPPTPVPPAPCQGLAIRALVVQKWRMFARRSFLCELAMWPGCGGWWLHPLADSVLRIFFLLLLSIICHLFLRILNACVQCYI